MGKDHLTAAREGTDEIGLAVMATTFAICAVFVPVAFMSGIVGKFFFPFGITVAVAVLVSLFVSFTLDPMLSQHLEGPAEEPARDAAGDRPPDARHRPRHGSAARHLRAADPLDLLGAPLRCRCRPSAVAACAMARQRAAAPCTLTPRGIVLWARQLRRRARARAAGRQRVHSRRPTTATSSSTCACRWASAWSAPARRSRSSRRWCAACPRCGCVSSTIGEPATAAATRRSSASS